MSNIWSLSLKGWADNCGHCKDPESALLKAGHEWF